MYAAKMCFVLLAGAIEKGGEIPKDTIKAAVRRQKELDAGEGNVREHRFR